MDNLQTLAALAEIFGALTIVGAGLFGLLQLREYRTTRRQRVAADLCRQFSAADTARAFKLVRQLPDNVSVAQVKEMDQEYEDAMLIVGMYLESIGLQVCQGIASFATVNELAGGMVTMTWRKLGRWIAEWRELDNDPYFGEWVQWLAERVAEVKSTNDPAYIEHANWKRYGS